MATVMNEGRHPAEFILNEEEMAYNREVVTIADSAKLEPGSVVGKITASGKYILSPAAEVLGSEGAEAAVGVLIYGVDASGGDVTDALILTRPGASVNLNRLVFDASVDDDAKIAAKVAELKAAGVVAR